MIEIKRAIELSFHGKSRIDPWQSEKVHGQGGLGYKSIPKVQQKTRVSAADASNHMIFEVLNGALSRVVSVKLGGHNLKSDSIAAHIII